MIRARISGGGKAFLLEIEGHSGYAPYGHDLICAAVSTLAFAVEKFLVRLDSEGLLIKHEKSLMDSGRAVTGGLPEAQAAERLQGAFELAECFLALLQEHYPENIRLTAENGRKGRNNNGRQA